jgi:hypothetical protein
MHISASTNFEESEVHFKPEEHGGILNIKDEKRKKVIQDITEHY